MTPHPLTLDELANLRDRVARLWPEIARAQGLREACAGSVSDAVPGLLSGAYVAREPDRAAYDRALEHLARALEDAGYAIARRGSARVVLGWAMVPCGVQSCIAHHLRVVDLDMIDPMRAAYHERLTAEREARDRAERGPVQLFGKDKRLAAAMRRAAGGQGR